jgi:hypothetical protein
VPKRTEIEYVGWAPSSSLWDAHTIPELAIHLGLSGWDTHPQPQLQTFLTAAAFVIAEAGASLAGLVAGLTLSHFLVTVEARVTFLHTVATFGRTQEKEA